MPTLDDIARDPQIVAEISAIDRGLLIARCAAVIAALSVSVGEPASIAKEAMPPALPEKLLQVPEVAEILGFARGYTYELVRAGEIRAVHKGRHWRITPAAVEEFIRANEFSKVDKPLSLMLSRLNDRRRPQASTKDARTRPSGIGEAPRRASDDGEQMGARRGADS